MYTLPSMVPNLNLTTALLPSAFYPTKSSTYNFYHVYNSHMLNIRMQVYVVIYMYSARSW